MSDSKSAQPRKTGSLSPKNDIEFSSNTPKIWRAGSRHTLQTTHQPTISYDLNYVRDDLRPAIHSGKKCPKWPKNVSETTPSKLKNYWIPITKFAINDCDEMRKAQSLLTLAKHFQHNI